MTMGTPRWWLLLGVACGPTQGTVTVREPGLAPFQVLAEGAGYTVSAGKLAFMDQEDCCAAGANCFGSNPTTPYGSYALPAAPDQERASPPPEPSHELFLIRPDEAVVFLGIAPPEARYFSFRTYLWARAGAVEPVFGALGPTINHLSVAASLGTPPWDQPLAVVTTADASVEAEVIALLVASGWDRPAIATDRIPLGDAVLGLNPGVTDDSDEYATIVRVALPDDPERLEAWKQAPGTLLRLSPRTPHAASRPHPFAGFPTEERGSVEGLDEALTGLESAVHRAYPDRFRVVRDSVDASFDSPECVVAGACFGGTMDAEYRRLPATLLRETDFLVLYGVNHQHTGRATYSSFSIDQAQNWYGVLAVEDRTLEGTAQTFLDDPFRSEHPEVDPDDLWAWIVARDCTTLAVGGRPCTEIATTCPGVALDDAILPGFRAYLDPETGTRPSQDELVHPRGTLFFEP
jgi:hypothetical protein